MRLTVEDDERHVLLGGVDDVGPEVGAEVLQVELNTSTSPRTRHETANLSFPAAVQDIPGIGGHHPDRSSSLKSFGLVHSRATFNSPSRFFVPEGPQSTAQAHRNALLLRRGDIGIGHTTRGSRTATRRRRPS